MNPNRRDFLRLSGAAAAAAAFRGSAVLASPDRGSGVLAASEAPGTALPRKPLGLALLGLGNYAGHELAPALQQTKLCRLTGLVSGHPEKAAQWARQYAVPQKNIYNYENFDRIADNPDVDIVYVVTPPAIHPEFVIRAAKAGKHVISEKPMATNVADCDRMIAACREARVQLGIGYRLFWDPYHGEMRRLARDGDFGLLKRMTGRRSFVVNTMRWRIDKKLAGGGPMMDLGIYVVQGACMAANGATPVAVTAREEPKLNPELFREVEETMSWTMEFPEGQRCAGWSSFNHPGTDYFKAEGDKGWIEFREHAFTYKGIVAATSRGPLHFPAPFQQALQMDDFADCVLTGRPTPVPGEMGRRDIRILTAIYQAAASGKRVLV
jgi:glucose-fructose oxidoreductase